MSQIFYAKPEQTYDEHLFAAYKAWKEVIAQIQPFIDRIALKYKFSAKRFLQGSLLSVALHDSGKMIRIFQDMMSAVREGRPFDKRKNYRHEIVSSFITLLFWTKMNKREPLSSLPLELLAIAGHHKKLDGGMNSFIRESLAEKPEIISEGIKKALETAHKIFQEEHIPFDDISIPDNTPNPLEPLRRLLTEGISKIYRNNSEDIGRVRILYSILKGILHYADWHGSAGIEVNYSVKPDSEKVLKVLEERCKKKGIRFSGLRNFQEECIKTLGHLIAVAPTGSGKTEASILWALNNLKDMGAAKIIYLLPTKNTANSIWERMTDFFEERDAYGNMAPNLKANVGLSHSSANLFLEDYEEESSATKEDEEDKRNLLFDRSFVRPINVATVDQLLTIGFNSGHWTMKELNAANAVIVVDEIHSYDSWTLGLLVETIKHFASLGSRFMLMSATLPSNLINLFKSILDARIIRDEQLLGLSRSKYVVREERIDESESIEIIRKSVENGKKVLVVVNTVKLCQELAKIFEDLDPICYHSMFILNDRQGIEKRIEDKNEDNSFVIATQVVEVALDIDYDDLFTECAPPDCIAQRAGRVNRYRDPSRDSTVYIFQPTEKSEAVYRSKDKSRQTYDAIFDGLGGTVLERSMQQYRNLPEKVTEQTLIETVETVYEGHAYDNDDVFKDACNQYRQSQKIRLGILDSLYGDDDAKNEVTRMSTYETRTVIPLCFKSEVLNLKRICNRQKYEIKIPYWYFANHKESYKGIDFCDVTYSSRYGAELFPQKPEIEGMSESGTTLSI